MLAASFTTCANAWKMKLPVDMSTSGRWPAMAAPMAAPASPSSDTGGIRGGRKRAVERTADRGPDFPAHARGDCIDLSAIEASRGDLVAQIEDKRIAVVEPARQVGIIRSLAERPAHLPFAANQLRPELNASRPARATHTPEPRPAPAPHVA